MARRALGRGLEALLPQAGVGGGQERVAEVEVGLIRPSPWQPRREMDEESLEELAASIRQHGVVQPVILRPAGGGYELVAGERRWRAAQRAGQERIPAVVRDFSDAEMMEIALIENLQREDLNPMEEALAFRTLIEEFGLTQEDLARRIGKSRPHITNTLRLLTLEQPVQEMVSAGKISMGHAKALLSLESKALRRRLAERIVAAGLSVRQAEEAARRLGGTAAPGRSRQGRAARDPVLADIEGELRSVLGTRVTISSRGKKGRIEIEYYGAEDLERITGIITGRREEGGPQR